MFIKNILNKKFLSVVLGTACLSFCAVPNALAADECNLKTSIGETAGTAKTLSEKEFGVDYGTKGSITGNAFCSSKEGDNNNNTWENPTTSTEKPGGEGGYCYCQLTGYTPNGGEAMSVSAPWVFLRNYESECNSSCAENCALVLKYKEMPYLNFRTAMFLGAQCRAGGESTSGHGDKIVIATNKYNENVFSPVTQALANVRTTLKNLITQSRTNTEDIADLETNKQTRPATECPADKKCLLVKDPQGVNRWYEIVDCGGDGFLSNVGTPERINFSGSNNSYYTSGTCNQGDQTTYGCTSSEGIESYTNGIVFFQSIRLNIMENTRGAIVVLPEEDAQNNPNGNVTLCRVTGYREKDGNGGYLPRVNVDTDKWVVSYSAECYRYLSGDGNSQQEKLDEAKAYYAILDNTCANSSNYGTVSMCDVNDFLNNVGQAETVYPGSSYAMGKNSNGTNDGLCSTLAGSNKACGTNEFVSSYGNGLVYGVARNVSISNTQDAIVRLPDSVQDVPDSYAGTRACVCKVTGYSAKSGSTYAAKQSFDTDLWIVVGGQGGCQDYCARGVYATTYNDYYQSIASSCTDLTQFADAAVVTPSCDSSLERMCNGTWEGAPTCTCTCPEYSTLTEAGRCSCAEGYDMQNGECVESRQECSSELRGYCTTSGGTYDDTNCECTCPDHSTLTSGGRCDCENGYDMQNGVCVVVQQSCMNQDGALLRKQNCVHSAGTASAWSDDTCQCDCSYKAHTVLNSEGSCVCDTGYIDQNGTCVADDGCDRITNLIEPGYLREGGEAWVVNGEGLWGGKACDGRWGLYANNPSDPSYAYNTSIINGINKPGVTPTTNACLENEWLHVHDNVAVYGDVRVVAIEEDTPGTIISLPSNVQNVNTAGGVCVCRVTAYAPVLASGQYGPTEFGDRTSIDTGNKWFIAGRREYYGNETVLQACITDCAFYSNSPNLISYYDYVGNGCSSVSGSSATACQVADPKTTTVDPYMTFVNAGVNQKWIKNPTIGFAALDKQGKGTGICENSTATYCQKIEGDLTAWAMQMTITDPNKYFNAQGEQVSNGYNGQTVLFGRARCVVKGDAFNKLEGNQGMLVRLTEVPSNDTRGTVCIQNIAGYQMGDKGEMTSLNSNYWYARNFENAEACATACAGTNMTSQQMLNEIGELSEPVGGLCLNNEE